MHKKFNQAKLLLLNDGSGPIKVVSAALIQVEFTCLSGKAPGLQITYLSNKNQPVTQAFDNRHSSQIIRHSFSSFFGKKNTLLALLSNSKSRELQTTRKDASAMDFKIK